MRSSAHQCDQCQRPFLSAASVGNVWLQYSNTPFHIAALTGHVAVLKAMHAKGGNGLLDQQGVVRGETQQATLAGD